MNYLDNSPCFVKSSMILLCSSARRHNEDYYVAIELYLSKNNCILKSNVLVCKISVLCIDCKMVRIYEVIS